MKIYIFYLIGLIFNSIKKTSNCFAEFWSSNYLETSINFENCSVISIIDFKISNSASHTCRKLDNSYEKCSWQYNKCTKKRRAETSSFCDTFSRFLHKLGYLIEFTYGFGLKSSSNYENIFLTSTALLSYIIILRLQIFFFKGPLVLILMTHHSM